MARPTPAPAPTSGDNGALYTLGFAMGLVAVDAINRRKNKTEFIENAAIATTVGLVIEFFRGKR